MSDETAGLHQAGSNISGLKDAIAAGMKTIQQHKLDRTSSNENIAATLADLKAKGVSPTAFKMAMKVAEMDPEDREGFDIAYDICREAMGKPYNAQGNLFTDTKEGREAVANRPAADPVDFGGAVRGDTSTDDMSEEDVKDLGDEMDAADVPDEATDEFENNAFGRGQSDYADGVTLDGNPFDDKSERIHHGIWAQGWQAAFDQDADADADTVVPFDGPEAA